MINRRGFVRAAGGAALFNIVPAHLLRGDTAPSNQLTRAIIGTGGIAASENHLSYPGSRMIAICDVDSNHLDRYAEKAKAKYGALKKFRDFRDVLALRDVDIVHIATPPHWHGVLSVMAAKAGKDIWCEKPMTRTLGEGRRVIEAVQANKRIFRLNTWFRFMGSFYGFGREVKPLKKIVQNRLLGWPIKATIGTGTGFTWKFNWSGRIDLKPEPVPPNLDYDLWLGPAPYKPYHPHRVHANFRGYWDYDGGGLGDMGQHYLDAIQYVLEKDETSPVSIDVDAPPQHADAAGSFRTIRFKYADGCEIILDGTGLLKAPLLEGPEGKIFPKMESNLPDLDRWVDRLPDPIPQLTDFELCVRERRPFALNEMNGFRSCTLVNLGIVAMRLGRGFTFDPVNLRAVNDPAVDRLLYQSMRSPWQI